ncbi:MAG: hypothetical protein V4497_08215 [Bacteroidota bacterium]
MIKHYFKAASLVFAMFLFSCSTQDLIEENPSDAATTNPSSTEMSKNTASKVAPTVPTTSKTWNFDNLTEWVDATQVGNPNYWIEDGTGILHMFTNANTWERVKVKNSSGSYANGTYNWRVYVPTMGVGDMASIGAFLYNNDTHELDFEIGYGNQSIRQQLNAAEDDLVAYMTSQANPFQSYAIKIKKEQWYNLTLELTLNSKGRYVVNWKINNTVVANATLTYGKTTRFNIFCSVENLTFIGDHIPSTQNYALFDSVEFRGN